ncbi:MAG: US12 family protein [Sedimentisphaerales bacterium]|nr:US12 family protein [Sedimentisphaerales bacterium]
MFKSNVFERTDANGRIISNSRYNLVIGMVLCWGFLVNWLLVVCVDPEFLRSINFWLFIAGYFASCFYGVYLFNKSDKPHISFLGYNFVVVPFGLVVNMVVSVYDTEVVVEAIKITGGVTIVMMILGSIFPNIFKKAIIVLTIALLVVIIVELFQMFILGIHHNWIDWAVAAIFCGYIGYDWGRANQIPKTMDNAVDSAAALYMDIINLFLRILRILGRRR